MKPFKIAYPLTRWLLRLALLLFTGMTFWNTYTGLHFDIGFAFAAGFGLFALLLFIGGFVKGNGLTVIPGLLYFALAVVYMARIYSGTTAGIQDFVIPALLGFYFFTSPEK